MTNEKIREACDALLSGRAFHTTTSRNYTVFTKQAMTYERVLLGYGV